MADVGLGGRMPMDGDRHKIQAPTKSQFQDGADTPVPSPKTAIGTTAVALRVPANAVALVVYATAAGRFGYTSTLDGAAGQGYRKIPATTERIFPVAAKVGADVYLRAESGTIDVDFEFRLLGT